MGSPLAAMRLTLMARKVRFPPKADIRSTDILPPGILQAAMPPSYGGVQRCVKQVSASLLKDYFSPIAERYAAAVVGPRAMVSE